MFDERGLNKEREVKADHSLQDEKAANEPRERELKEKIKKMRSSKSGDDHVEANAA
jgi:serine/arginine repetitive matrix protein 1